MIDSVRSIMKKAICILLTAALVVGFAFILVACNKDTTETFEMTDDNMSELRTLVSDCRTAESFRTVISKETKVSGGTEKVNSTVTVYSNNIVEYEIVTTAADGSVTKEYVMANTSSYAYARYTGDNATPDQSSYDSNPPAFSEILSDSGCSEAVTKVTNIIRSGSSYIITQKTGTRYLNKGNLLRTVYTIGFDNEAGDVGTAYVTVTDGVITRIEITSDSGKTAVDYSYDCGQANMLKSAEWYLKHPKA